MQILVWKSFLCFFVCLFLPMANYSLAWFPNFCPCKQKRTELRLLILALHRSTVECELLFICKLSSAAVGTAVPPTVSKGAFKKGTTVSPRAPRLPKQIAKGLAALPCNVRWASSALPPHFQLLLPICLQAQEPLKVYFRNLVQRSGHHFS